MKKIKLGLQSSYFRQHKNMKTILFVLLGIFIIYILFFIFFWPSTKCFLEKIEPGFAVSFSASLLEDLLFFTVVSLIVIILTTKDLKEYTFSEKVNALINSSDVSGNQDLEAYLDSEIFKRSVYDKKLMIDITVSDYDATENAYKLFFDVRFEIASMCNDHSLRNMMTYWKVNPSDAVVRSEYGHITKFEVVYPDGRIEYIIPADQEVKLDKLYEEKVPIEISKKTEIVINLHYFSWSKTGAYEEGNLSVWNYIKCQRLTRLANFTIRNQLLRALEFKVCSHSVEELKDNSVLLQKEGSILPGRTLAFPVTRLMQPGEDYRVFFK